MIKILSKIGKIIVPNTKEGLALRVIAVLTLLGGIAIGKTMGRDVVTNTVVDTIPPPQMQQRLENLRNQAEIDSSTISRLKNTVRGLEERQPTRIIRTTDTVRVPVPDTVVGTIMVDENMRLHLSEFIRVESDTVPGRKPEITEFDISRCDDGIAFSSGSLVCNKPTFGHLYLSGMVHSKIGYKFLVDEAALVGEVGFTWEPYYRSYWQIDVTYGTDNKIRLRIQRKFELF